MADYIVVPASDAQLMRVGLAMILAERLGTTYPLPGPTYYVWDPQPNVAETHCAFGPLDSLGGDEADFGEYCLGRTIPTSLGTLTVPSAAQALEASWFKPAPPPPL